MNATVRMTGVSKPTILKLLKDLGCAGAAYHDDHVRGLKPARIECDETWAFVHCKHWHVARAKAAPSGAGDAWTWTAIDPDSKLMLAYHVGRRTPMDAQAFMLDLAGRVTNLPQLTTDGYGAYPDAVYEAFGTDVDYAQLIKVYRAERSDHARYSPAECVGCRKRYVIGAPDPAKISTSIIERSDLTIRKQSRRFTRLTNGHTKTVENHGHSDAMFFTYHNFCRKHETLKGKTPAQACGLADRRWSLDELVGLIG